MTKISFPVHHADASRTQSRTPEHACMFMAQKLTNRTCSYVKEKIMYYTPVKNIIRVLVIIALVGFGLKPTSAAMMFDNNNGPELPAGCESINAPEGNKLAFHVYAKGVQIYKYNGFKWEPFAPLATLYAEPNYFGEIGTHYVGPHWESKSGSKVKAERVLGTGCTPDSTAVAWLLLKKVETSGNGIFSKVTYIQRTNTTGGLTPTEAGALNELKEVPYTAEYYFYRSDSPELPQ
jgi:hypothetical protein